MKETVILIVRQSTWESWLSDAGTFCLFLALIGMGVALNSTAMQWAGFLVGVVVVVGRTAKQKAVHKVIGYEAAHAKLKELRSKEELH